MCKIIFRDVLYPFFYFCFLFGGGGGVLLTFYVFTCRGTWLPICVFKEYGVLNFFRFLVFFSYQLTFQKGLVLGCIIQIVICGLYIYQAFQLLCELTNSRTGQSTINRKEM